MRHNNAIPPRRGLRIRGHRAHREVRAALIRFARWLRCKYDFPIRVPVYLSPEKEIRTIHGNKVSASFFAPFDRNVEPYIRIATGDYEDLKRERGRDNALAAFITSLSHEIIHYRQWIDTGDVWERGVAVKSEGILGRYAADVDHP